MSELKPHVNSIGSGTYTVKKSENSILECRLGTSVGIAVVDRENRVGGIYHILLPSPISETEIKYEPERYAESGMPVFFRELFDNGAVRENIEVTIAGGALVGPVSLRDLQMDIGGRIESIVKGFLAREGISRVKSETGGYFSCSLSLNFNSFLCDVKPIGYNSDPVKNNVEKVSLDSVDQTIARVRPIPQIAVKIVRMINSENYNMRDIAREVRLDQIISAKILKVANSAFFSPKSTIDSIDQALVMLGEKMILQLVVSTSVELFFKDTGNGYSLCKGGLFHHATGTATVAEKLANYSGMIKPDIAYTAGLLHDIGKVVLDQYVSRIYPLFYRKLFEDEMSLVEVEEELLGISHPEAGKRLAELWSLPDSIADVIAYHHCPSESKRNVELTNIVYLADLLMSRFQVGHELERIDADSLAYSLDVLRLDNSKLLNLIDMIPWQDLGALVVSGN